MAHVENSLIVDRLKAGLRNASAKVKRLGRLRGVTAGSKVGRLRAARRPRQKSKLGISPYSDKNPVPAHLQTIESTGTIPAS
jgi:hypothetical protein